jgi:hypothetical protein
LYTGTTTEKYGAIMHISLKLILLLYIGKKTVRNQTDYQAAQLHMFLEVFKIIFNQLKPDAFS